MKSVLRVISVMFLLCGSGLSWARGVYLTEEAFLQEAFGSRVPTAGKYWLTEADRETAEKILYHPLPGLRVRYWRQAARSAWIFDEIGKTEPITIGVVVEGQAIRQVQILEFRESRGWEVKYPFFRDQFVGATLHAPQQLSKNIDGITGATLSVNAVKKVAILALYLHEQVMAAAKEAAP